MVQQFRHGGYAQPAAGFGLEAIDVRTPFGYMFRQLADDPDARLPQDAPEVVRANLEKLGELMAVQGADKGDSTVPAGYTYWGQFIDHDITANDLSTLQGNDIMDRFDPVSPQEVINRVVNRRRPALDLDSLYGDGPLGEAAHFYEADGVKLRIGDNQPVNFVETPPPLDNNRFKRDLPRDAQGKPLIGDTRNDENLVVAQFHLGWMRFHNAVVDWLAANRGLAGAALAREAFRLTRWQYQWLVVNDYLPTIAIPAVVTDVFVNGGRFYNPSTHDAFEPFMPLEFSVAAFRFGHSMVRNGYDHNRNFGDPGLVQPFASFAQMFQFTFAGGGAAPQLPDNWIIEWDRFLSKADPDPRHKARRFDTGLALALSTMTNETVNPPHLSPEQVALMQHLAKRNLLRGYLFSLPTGQAVAGAMGEAALTPQELRENEQTGDAAQDALARQVNQVLEEGGFLTRTPLWYYILKEADVKTDGNSLGPIGSRIVAETLIGLIRRDPTSYLHAPSEWHPSQGVSFAGEPITNIMQVMRFAGVAV